MQKTKFKVQLHANGNHSNTLLQIIGNHNAGLANINLLVLCGYIKAKAAQYPNISDGNEDVRWENDNTIHIGQKGKDPYLSITECTYDELGEVGPETENDLAVLEQVEDVNNISQQGEQC